MSGSGIIRRDDVVDAEFISIDRADAMAERLPSVAMAGRQAVAVPIAEGMAMLSRDATLPDTPASTGGPIFWASGALIALAAFWMAGGHALFSAMAPASADDAAGLRIASVISRVDRSGEKPVLLVDGKAVNDSVGAVAMPPLHIQVVSAAGVSTLYKLGTAGQALRGGDSFDFSSRLDLPKDGVRTVFVTFEE